MNDRLPTDPTLDEMRAALAVVLPSEAVFDGWGDAARDASARRLGLDPGHAKLAFPDGQIGMIEAWYASIDDRLADIVSPDRLQTMKVRDRIASLVLARLGLVRPDRQAARTALAILARPLHAAKAAKLGWRAADVMWRLAGDTSTDLNFYTKRLTLAAVYASVLLVWLDDDSDDEIETKAFLDRRLADVMRFERLKGQFRPNPERLFSLTRFLGRLRYPAQ